MCVDVGQLLGGKIHDGLGKIVLPALDEAQDMAKGRTFFFHAILISHVNKPFMFCLWSLLETQKITVTGTSFEIGSSDFFQTLRMFVCVPVIKDTKVALENVNQSLGVLQQGTAQLQSNLRKVRADIMNALDDPLCADPHSHMVNICVNILSSLSQLEISANYSSVRLGLTSV